MRRSVVTRRALLEWQERVAQDVVEVGPLHDGSSVELPGPRLRRVRARIEPSAATGGALAARVLRGNGTSLPVLLLPDGATALRAVEVVSAPLGVVARDDGGCWSLHEGQVVHHAGDGTAVRAVALPALALVPAADNGVWAVAQRDAWCVAGDGSIAGPFDWQGGLRSAPADGGLAAPSRGAAPGLELLDGDGRLVAAIPVQPALDADEQLLACAGDTIVTRDGGDVRRRAGGRIETIALQSAGLARDGTPWISGRVGPRSLELRLGASVARLEVPDHPPGTLRVAAVDGDTVLVCAHDRAWRLRDGTVEESFALDEDRHRREVFPSAWELTAVVGAPSGTVLLGASGPPGLAVIALDQDRAT